MHSTVGIWQIRLPCCFEVFSHPKRAHQRTVLPTRRTLAKALAGSKNTLPAFSEMFLHYWVARHFGLLFHRRRRTHFLFALDRHLSQRRARCRYGIFKNGAVRDS